MSKISVTMVIIGLMFSVTFSIPIVQAEEVDSSTLRQGMHACPAGTYMTGFHEHKNLLLCESLGYGYDRSEERIDKTTVDFGMHVCPDGYAMTGIHVNQNLLLCAPLRDGTNLKFVDSLPTVRENMHACPFGLAMVGIHVNKNHFLCQYSLCE